jgi:hypothetical protein
MAVRPASAEAVATGVHKSLYMHIHRYMSIKSLKCVRARGRTCACISLQKADVERPRLSQITSRVTLVES